MNTEFGSASYSCNERDGKIHIKIYMEYPKNSNREIIIKQLNSIVEELGLSRRQLFQESP